VRDKCKKKKKKKKKEKKDLQVTEIKGKPRQMAGQKTAHIKNPPLSGRNPSNNSPRLGAKLKQNNRWNRQADSTPQNQDKGEERLNGAGKDHNTK